MILLFLVTLPLFAKNTILIVGDSLSASYGINQQQGWVNLLKIKLKKNNLAYTVVNASVSGDTTSNGLARLPTLLQKHQPVITIIELGGNDGLRGLHLQTIAHNLQKMIDLTKQSGSQVLLVGIRLPPNLGNDYTEAFYQIFVNLARKNNVAFVPFFLKNIDTEINLMQPDRIHPTAQAQKILLQNIWQELSVLLSN